MRVIVQRSLNAKCIVEGRITGEIDHGYMLLVGFTHDDNSEIVDKMVKKVLNLRIFKDENDKMNLNIKQVNGSILSISQFTLYADPKSGNRPSFVNSMNPSDALRLYEEFNDKLRKEGMKVETGEFGADMKIDFVNDGPVTIILEF